MTLRKIDSDLEGHPTPRLNFIDAATGSLGQGLSVGAGMAYVGKYIEHARYVLGIFESFGAYAAANLWQESSKHNLSPV